MAQWRSKLMKLDEWRPFQDSWTDLFIASGADEGMALFIRSNPGSDESVVLIPEHNAELVERLSPGGWGDRSNPHEVEWVLLGGRADAAEHFGLRLGTNSDGAE
jgi:hypothetical protein